MMAQPKPQRIAYGAKLVIMEGPCVSSFSLEGRSEWSIGRTETYAAPGVVSRPSPVISCLHGKQCKNGGREVIYRNPGLFPRNELA